MSKKKLIRHITTAGAIAALLLPLGGCAYDYLQRTDRVAYSAGDAVKANLESQTTNPSSDSQFNTGGLGKNGDVIPPEEEATPET